MRGVVVAEEEEKVARVFFWDKLKVGRGGKIVTKRAFGSFGEKGHIFSSFIAMAFILIRGVC